MQAHLGSAGSLARRRVHAVCDLSLCKDTEADELDNRLQLIYGNVGRKIFNAPLSACSSSGLCGSACKGASWLQCTVKLWEPEDVEIVQSSFPARSADELP